jgi:hypothetical protein
MYAAGSASRSRRARAYRNIPSGEADESSIEEIRVVDPRHPLYGRSFRVLRRSNHGRGGFAPFYEVEYRSGTSLLIPVSAIDYDKSGNNETKLSIAALHDLLSMIDCFDSHEYSSRSSLGDAVADSTASDRRRRRRSLGGGLP